MTKPEPTVYTSRTWPYVWIVAEGETLEIVARAVYHTETDEATQEAAKLIQLANEMSDPCLAVPGVLLILP